MTRYIWDVVSDNVLMETDSGGNTTVVYTQEPDHFGELISQRRGGQTSYYHFDGQGSTRALTDQNQNVTDEYTYSAFGETLAISGARVNPFGFGGAIGYYSTFGEDNIYIRIRQYVRSLGRWASLDPLQYQDSINGYCFVGSNPVTFDDPSGALTIVRVPVQVPDNLLCGSSFFVQWEVRSTAWVNLKPPKCNAWIVQLVTVHCSIADCPCTEDQPVMPRQDFSYLEAFRVPRNGDAVIVDTSKLRSFNSTCGRLSVRGTFRLFCENKMQPRSPWKDPSEKREFGTGKCAISPGILPAFQVTPIPYPGLPKWWDDFEQAEDEVGRIMTMGWQCCPCTRVFATPEVYP